MEKKFLKRKKWTAILISALLAVSQNMAVYAAELEQNGADYAEEGSISGMEEDSQDEAAPQDGAAEYVPGEVLIFYTADTTSEADAKAVVLEKDDVMAETVVTADDTTVSVVELSEESTVEESVEEYTSDPRIEFAMPNYILDSCVDESDTVEVQGTLNDGDYLSYQWYLDQIKAKGAWDIINAVQHEPVKVAVLDTGADISHPDLVNVIDLDDSGELISDSPDSLPSPLKGDGYQMGAVGGAAAQTTHGTHVAGILGAEANNGEGIAGTASAYDNSILDLSVIDIFPNQKTTSSYLFKGMEYAKQQGARVINISAGVNLNVGANDASAIIEGYSQVFDAFMNEGIIVVCAAGNADVGDGIYDNGGISCLPGDLSSTISVINVDRNSQKSPTSNYGSLKDISAPGTDIWSTKNGSTYGNMSGTSMAAPMVTGIVAMMLSVNPNLSFAQVRDILRNTAADINTAGFDIYTGYGLADAKAAVEQAAVSAGKWKTEGGEPNQGEQGAGASVTYKTHVQSYGWQDWVSDGQSSGTEGKAKRLESIQIKVDGKGTSGGIEYRTHVQTYGWQGWVSDGKSSGTEGEAKRLEAIRIRLTGQLSEKYDIYYRVHAQTYGWLDWAKNGEPAGSSSYAKRLEGIQIKLVTKDGQAPGATSNAYVHQNVKYQTHVQTYGWQGYVIDGAVSGTEGQAKRLEGIRIALADNVYGGDIEYQTHVQTYGWEEDWKKNGQMSGTQGQAKRLEAIRIRLTGEMAEKYDVYYQVHIQTFGWTGWAENGEPSGSAGMAKRLEGIRIVLVPKGGESPGSSNNAYYEK